MNVIKSKWQWQSKRGAESEGIIYESTLSPKLTLQLRWQCINCSRELNSSWKFLSYLFLLMMRICYGKKIKLLVFIFSCKKSIFIASRLCGKRRKRNSYILRVFYLSAESMSTFHYFITDPPSCFSSSLLLSKIHTCQITFRDISFEIPFVVLFRKEKK